MPKPPDDLPLIDFYLPVPESIKEMVDAALSSGKISPLQARLSEFPARVIGLIDYLGEYPGLVWIAGEVPEICNSEAERILRELQVVLSTTQRGRKLLREWRTLLNRTGVFMFSGLIRVRLGSSRTARAGILADTGCDLPLSTLKAWQSPKSSERFDKWKHRAVSALMQRWGDLWRRTAAVWDGFADIFREVALQVQKSNSLSVPELAGGKIAPKWQAVREQVEDYLGTHCEEDWPASQNQFAKLLGVSSTTLKKAITKSPHLSLARTWSQRNREWKERKGRISRSSSTGPAVISLHDAAEVASGNNDPTDIVAVRELLEHHTRDKLVRMLKSLIEKHLNHMKLSRDEQTSALGELNLKSMSSEEIAALLLNIKEQYEDSFDGDRETRFRRRRKP